MRRPPSPAQRRRDLSACGPALRLLPALLLVVVCRPVLAATVEELKAKAEGGDVRAVAKLAARYEEGRGVTKDLSQACALYQQAAEKGDADSQRALGALYELGRGCARDLEKAGYWYRKAADQGVARAQANLGVLYEEGKGVAQDYTEAARWYRLSVARGYPRGQYLLGRLYERGLGVEKNLAVARSWYEKAAAAGYSRAKSGLQALSAPPVRADRETVPAEVAFESGGELRMPVEPPPEAEGKAAAETAPAPGPEAGLDTAALADSAAERHFYQGNRLAGDGRLQEAVGEYERSLALEPENPNTLENIAITWAKLGEIDKGLAYMTRAVEAAPADAGKYASLGIMLHAAEKEDEALARYRQAIRLDPTLAGVYFNMAVVYAGRRQLDKAWRSLQMAEQFGRDGGELRSRLAEQQPEPDRGWLTVVPQGQGLLLRQILVASRQEAEDVLRRLAAGEDFRELAGSRSIAPSRFHKGYLGKVTAGEIDAGLFAALKDLQPFAFSPALESPGGWSVFQRLFMPEEILQE